ncbi:Calx-beta domain-containing protein [Paenibacillus solisilvae]|uniref:Calx-beta domain-containing protein n=1 Tax=Paenibacillus solisilvae TaxID=2486751 RepID=A0ABW0W6C5_9BACL
MFQHLCYRFRKSLARVLSAVILLALLAPAIGQAAFAASPVELGFVAASQKVSESSLKNVKVRRTGGADLVFGASKTEVTIRDNGRGGILSFDTPTYFALEESGPIHMKVLRTNGFEGIVTVHYSLIPVTATPGEDYIDQSGTLTFNSYQKTFDIDIIDDNVPEGPETFILKLSDPTGGAKLGTLSERLITIYDKDNVSMSKPPGSLQLQPSRTINEADGTISLEVSRVYGNSGTVTVDYATSNGTAAAGSDFEFVSGTLTFASGESSKTITVPILNENNEEGDERFTVTLSNPTGGAKLTDGASATVITIKSNDHYGKLYFDTPTYYTLEESGSIHMKVLRQGGFDGPVTVHYSIIPITATPGEDYTDVSGTLTFSDGDSSRTFDIEISDDDIPEGAESFILKLSVPEEGAKLGTPSQRVITIYDKDAL